MVSGSKDMRRKTEVGKFKYNLNLNLLYKQHKEGTLKNKGCELSSYHPQSRNITTILHVGLGLTAQRVTNHVA